MSRSPPTPELVRGLEAAINKHYGLNLKVSYTAAESYAKTFSKLMTEHKTGTKPTFDAVVGQAVNIISGMDAGAFESIQNWKELAPKGTPLNDQTISPPVLKNTAFKVADSPHFLVYNTKLISKADLPKKLADFGNPQYKGKFSVLSAVAAQGLALSMYDKEKVLDIYRSWGKNEPKIMSFSQGVDRLVLGELWMVPFTTDYVYYRRKEAGDPVGMTVIQDLASWISIYTTVRMNAPNANAARLWALYNTGPEAQRIWEKEIKWMNFSCPQQSGATEFKKLLDDTGAKAVSWTDSEETWKLMRWLFTSEEGEAYQKRLQSAIQEGR